MKNDKLIDRAFIAVMLGIAFFAGYIIFLIESS